MESNQLNKSVFRKKLIYESDNKHKEQQKDKHEDVKKEHKSHKMWGMRVRKSRLFYF